jgi:hypothetical protein
MKAASCLAKRVDQAATLIELLVFLALIGCILFGVNFRSPAIPHLACGIAWWSSWIRSLPHDGRGAGSYIRWLQRNSSPAQMQEWLLQGSRNARSRRLCNRTSWNGLLPCMSLRDSAQTCRAPICCGEPGWHLQASFDLASLQRVVSRCAGGGAGNYGDEGSMNGNPKPEIPQARKRVEG